MKLNREFKSKPTDFAFIDENDDLEKLQRKAEKIALEEDKNIEIAWNMVDGTTASIVAFLKIDEESSLVIRR